MATVSTQMSKYIGAATKVADIWGNLIINVKDATYGAKGDGTTDDTIAIQAAIDHANAIGKKEIYFPVGTYKYTILTDSDEITIVGDGVTLTGTTELSLTSISELKEDKTQRGYNIMSSPYNASGDGSTDDSSAFNDALTDIGSTTTWLFLPAGTYKLSSSITIPSNVTLVFAAGAMLSPDSGKTVTINGPFEAGIYQIFTGSGTIIGTPTVQEFYTEWWGAKGDGATADQTAINAAITAVNAFGGGVVRLISKVYLITGTITMKEQTRLIGNGSGAGTGTGLTEITAQVNGVSAINLPAGSYEGIALENFVLQFSGSGTKGDGITLNNFTTQCILRNIFVKNFANGIHIVTSYYFTAENLHVTHCTLGFLLDGVNGVDFVNCSAGSCTDSGIFIQGSSRNLIFSGGAMEANVNGIWLSNCFGVRISCYFESNTSNDIVSALQSADSSKNARGVTISNCYFAGGSFPRAINVNNSAKAWSIYNNLIGDRTTAGINISSTASKIYIGPNDNLVTTGSKVVDAASDTMRMSEENLLIVGKVYRADYGGNFASLTTPTAEKGKFFFAQDTNSGSPAKRIYVCLDGSAWSYSALT